MCAVLHIFQADMSISFDPLRSFRCLDMGPSARCEFVCHGSASEPLSTALPRAETTAMTVAAHFNTIPCSFGLHRDADVTLMKLIREARLCVVPPCTAYVPADHWFHMLHSESANAFSDAQNVVPIVPPVFT